MVCSKHEESPVATKSHDCHGNKSFGPWTKVEHHHHHHHYHLFKGMRRDAASEEKQDHCHRSKFGTWWEHKKFGHHQELQEKQMCFFRRMSQKQNNMSSEKSDILFDYSENYN